MALANLLVVEDEELIARLLVDVLTRSGYAVKLTHTAREAKLALDASDYHAVLLDMGLPDAPGEEVLRHALDRAPPPEVLVITGQAEIQGAVAAMRLGATDYVAKPFNVADIGSRVARALDAAAARRKLHVYEAEDENASSAVIASQSQRDLFAVAGRLAATPQSSALILGESGVGKEVLASYIHQTSERRVGPFVRVNLAAIPEPMVEAELFGSVRGAFTDSKRDRAGHFASAEGGTLLLDELCEFKPELQPKLLRVLEERRFFPVGSDRERPMNVRVLAATNRDPQAAIASGHLRADLYYRLATVTLRVSPLRERVDDIVPLAEHFLRRFAAEFKRPTMRFHESVAPALRAYAWPGNVRELRNAIERAVMLAPAEVVGLADIDLPIPLPIGESTGSSLRLEDVERAHILRVLETVDQSRTRAAEALGISRSTLWEKLKRYGIASE